MLKHLIAIILAWFTIRVTIMIPGTGKSPLVPLFKGEINVSLLYEGALRFHMKMGSAEFPP